jgi:6-phosphofructokinase 2
MSEYKKSCTSTSGKGGGIVTVTVNPVIDSSTEVQQLVAERKLRCDRPLYEPGGGGINVSRVIKRLGGSSTAIYMAGSATGKHLGSLLDMEGIVHRAVEIADRTRVNFTVREKSRNRQFRFGMPGPFVREQEWEQLIDRLYQELPPSGFVVASGSLAPGVPDDFYVKIARKLKDKKIRFVLDTSGEPLVRAARQGVYLLKPNMREFRELVQRDITDEREQEQQASALIERGACEVLVISLGSAGVLLATSEGTMRIRAPSVPIRSKIGAGDSTVAGLVLGMHNGMSLEESTRFGIAAGAAAVMTPGTELCRSGDTFRLYKQLSK